MSDTLEVGAKRISRRSPAKINWTLRVLGKREDGFHELESLVSMVTLYDELEFTERPSPGVVLQCDAPEVPADETNLVCRAAALLAEEAERRAAIECRLSKRIPAGGGMGGGSSNAAATLLALNQLWNLDWSKEKLADLAGQLGSDVTLFLEEGSAVMSGRGERVRPVRLGWSGWIVLLMPGIPVATAAVYRAWRSGGTESRPVELPVTDNAIKWMDSTFNMLEAPAIEVCPELGRLQQSAAELAGRPARISGSGSTMFTAFDRQDQAMAFAAEAARRLGVRTEVVRPVEQS